MAVGALQLVGAICLMFVIARDLPNERRPTSCFFGMFELVDMTYQLYILALILTFSIPSFGGSSLLYHFRMSILCSNNLLALLVI